MSRLKKTTPLFATLFATIVASLSFHAEVGATTYFTNQLPITTGTNQCTLQYYSNRDPSQYSTNITQILICNHGISYDGFNYMTYGIAAAARVPGASTNTLVLAPALYTNAFTTPASNAILYWLEQPSFGSQHAAYGNPTHITLNFSPYAALDALSSFLVNSTNFPNLSRIMWFGFSGGGQLINRYAACSTQSVQAAARGIHTRYICGSPSSYVYMDGQRPNTNLPGQFYVPSASTYPTYNQWGYGLSNLYSYPNAVGSTFISNQYRQTYVVYCVGTLDNDPNDSTLDTSDEAELQGNSRWSRATNYFAYMSHIYGSNISLFQAFCPVTNVSHQASNVLTSDQGIKAVFDYEVTPVDTDHDGFSDWQEFLAGTNPTNALDYPKLSTAKSGAGSISVSWSAKPSRRYHLLSTQSLGSNWLSETNILATNSVSITNTFQAVTNRAFYRLQINPQ